MTAAFVLANIIVFVFLWKKKWRSAALATSLLALVCTVFLLLRSAAPFVSEAFCEILGKPVFDVMMDVLTAPYWHAVSLPFLMILPVFIGEIVLIALLSSVHVVCAIVRKISSHSIQLARAPNYVSPFHPTWRYQKHPPVCYLYCTMLC